MTRVTTLDGRTFEIDERLLRSREIPADKVATLLDRDELPDAPPAGALPTRELPPHLMAKWMAEGIDLPVPDEARGVVRARAFPDGRLVIDVNVAVTLGAGGPGGPANGPMQSGPSAGGSCGPTSCGPAAGGPTSCG